MRTPSFPWLGNWPNSIGGAALIGVGLAVLIASTKWPGAPILTAEAVITLGATEATVSRFRERAAFLPVVLLHASTYAALYLLFVGARLHGIGSASVAGASYRVMLDLAASALPIGVAAHRISTSLLRSITPGR